MIYYRSILLSLKYQYVTINRKRANVLVRAVFKWSSHREKIAQKAIHVKINSFDCGKETFLRQRALFS